MRIGYFAYKPGGNPYQALFANAIESEGNSIIRIPPRKAFPLNYALSHQMDLLQLDWPHDWYEGRNGFTRAVKRIMYEIGLAKLAKQPSVWTAHNLVAHDTHHVEYDRNMIQKLIDVSDGIIVMSEQARIELQSLYKIPHRAVLKVIPHGNYIGVYPNTITRDCARQKLKIELSTKVVLSLGRLLPYKGIEDLIVAFGSLIQEDSLLLIAGSCSLPEYHNKLLDLAEKYSSATAKIRISEGFVKDEDLQFYFNASDVVALPFKSILNSGSLLLAMSFGKCVIAPNFGSVAEVAIDDGWFRYQHDSKGGLVEALFQSLSANDIIEREKLVLEYTSSKYDWSNTGKRAGELYKEILERYR